MRKLLSAQLSKTLVKLFFIFFTNILKIIVILFCSIKINRIFVKEITTKTNRNYESIIKQRMVKKTIRSK